MKALDVFLPKINVYAPGVAVPTAFMAIRDAANDFCTRTRLWRFEDSFTVSSNEAEAITTPDGSVLLDLELVKFDGVDLLPKTTAWLDAHERGWREGLLTGTPRYITQLDMNTLRLVPGQAGTVAISAWLKPADDCLDLPDFLGDQFRECIAFGALARILLIPNQPYTNPQMAQTMMGGFEAKVNSLSVAGSRGQQRARTRTTATYY